jgi:hypothetical protein
MLITLDKWWKLDKFGEPLWPRRLSSRAGAVLGRMHSAGCSRREVVMLPRYGAGFAFIRRFQNASARYFRAEAQDQVVLTIG